LAASSVARPSSERTELSKRRLILPCLFLAFSLSFAACGGGGSDDESKIEETIEKAATESDPANCTKLETQAFAEQNSQEKGAAAVKACEKEAEEEIDQAEGATVSNVEVDGEKATAEVEFEGGGFDGQVLEVALVEEGGNWKLDQTTGFAEVDPKKIGESFQEQFEKSPEGLTPQQVSCIVEGISGASKAELEKMLLSGSSQALVELAEGCA
jgi:hypothetical protein